MNDRLVFNGINGATGTYLQPEMTPEEFAKNIQRNLSASTSGRAFIQHLNALRRWLKHLHHDHLGTREGIDPRDLSQTGWAVVFAHDTDPAVREALGELLNHRRRLATGRKEHYYREFWGPTAYQPGEEKWDFLNAHGAGFGPADPENVPYYLLLVGDPETIPYRFQYELDVEYAVGRLHFETPEEYAAYARAVVDAEQKDPVQTPRAAFFGVRNHDDLTTQQSADFLVEPMAETVAREHPNWGVDVVLKEEATKAHLSQLLANPPTFLLSASHGIAFPKGHRRQLPHQGALLCQDWPGPRAWRKKGIPEDHYFSADDLASETHLKGLIAFHFGCYGAGTPRLEAYAHRHGGTPAVIAPQNFVARLPQRLLAQGALAVVAHVEQCWGYSYLGMEGGERLQTFESSFARLLNGHPVGSAMDYFNRRYAEISVALSSELKRLRYGKQPDERKLTRLWTAEQDARSYVVLGDPAVRPAIPGAQPGQEER